MSAAPLRSTPDRSPGEAVAHQRPFDGPAGDLLLSIAPLMHVLRGDKRARLQRAFINTVLDMASRALRVDEKDLPPNAPAAARNLHIAAIELALRAGVSRVELVQDFNELTVPQASGDLSESIERCLSLISLFHARRIQQTEEPT